MILSFQKMFRGTIALLLLFVSVYHLEQMLEGGRQGGQNGIYLQFQLGGRDRALYKQKFLGLNNIKIVFHHHSRE